MILWFWIPDDMNFVIIMFIAQTTGAVVFYTLCHTVCAVSRVGGHRGTQEERSPSNATWQEVACVNSSASPAETECDISTPWRENNSCGCTLSLSNKSQKGRSILHLISRMWMAKAALWKALHAWNALSSHSLSHSFQKRYEQCEGEEDREKGDMGRRGSHEYE